MGRLAPRSRVSIAVAVVLAALSAACAARLSHPVPVREAEAWLVKRTTVGERRERDGRPTCVEEVTLEIVHLPGAAYELDLRPGLFASNEFSVTLHESGTLKQVTLNSDPQVDETLEAAGVMGAKLAEAVGRLGVVRVTPQGEIAPSGPCTPSATLKLAPLACFAEPRPPELDPSRCPAPGTF